MNLQGRELHASYQGISGHDPTYIFQMTIFLWIENLYQGYMMLVLSFLFIEDALVIKRRSV